MIGEIEIEQECIADLLRQKADVYLDAYERTGLKIGADVDLHPSNDLPFDRLGLDCD